MCKLCFQQLRNAWKVSQQWIWMVVMCYLYIFLSGALYPGITILYVMSATKRSCTDTSTALICTLLSSTFITFGNLDFWSEAEWIIYNTGHEILLIIRRLIRNPEIECDSVIVSLYSSGLCVPAFPCNRAASTPARLHLALSNSVFCIFCIVAQKQ